MTGQHPRLRHHTRTRKSGKVTTYYFYDRRPDGLPDVPLGKDYEAAVEQWNALHNHAPRIAGTVQEALEGWTREVLPTYEKPRTRRGYAQNMKQLKEVFGRATWDTIDLPRLKNFLKKRTAKTQANREMSLFQIIWNWARGEGLTKMPWPAADLKRSRWKNKERARRFEVTDELFAAVYAEADAVLRDCMDLSTATGMRLDDCRTVVMPRGDLLHLEASKTGKEADFDLSLSRVLPDLIARRRGLAKAAHLMLLSTPSGRPVSETMLRDRYEAARAKAAKKAKAAGDADLAAAIKAMYLRDMRKRASDLVESDEAASKLLQHGDVATTRKHYRTKATRLTPAR